MKIKSIEISDTFGTKHANFCPGTVTRIRGANGSGKSSILRALGYVFEGGTDPSVIRKGAESSTITMTLDDGTVISKVTRPKRARKGGEITGYTTDLEVTQPDGEPKGAPKTYIEELSRHMAVDPSVLLKIDTTTVPGRKALAAKFMELVPITFTPEDIERAYRRRPGNLPPDTSIAIPSGLPVPMTLDDLKKIHSSVTEQRKRIGITRDDASGAVARLRKSLPEHDSEDHRGQLAKLEEERLEIERAIADRRVEIEQEKSKAVTAATQAWQESVRATNAEIDAKIRELEAERTRRNNAAKEEQLKQTSAAERAAAEMLADLDKEAKPMQSRVNEQITIRKEALAAHQRAEGLRQEIEVQESAAHTAAVQYDRLSEVLLNIEKLRTDKLNNLPVDGLTVEDGFAYLDGIPWENVNLQRRIFAVVQIATQLSGKLPFVLIDDCEHLDEQNRNALEQGLQDAGFQLLEAIVSDEPLTIECQEGVAA